jgi:hypothetical protein
VVFNGMSLSLALIPKSYRDDVVLWRAWLPLELRSEINLWLTYLRPVRPWFMALVFSLFFSSVNKADA